MNIGIVLNDITPTSGGASSLISTIKKEIQENVSSKNNYIILYNGGNTNPYSEIVDNIKYINIDFSTKLYKNKIIRKLIAINKKIGKKLFHKNKETISLFDTIAKAEEIDIYYLTSPTMCVKTEVPYIYTVWDLGHRTTPYFPEVSRTGWKWQSREDCYQQMLYKASYILTGNEEGKKEILTNYPVNPNKICISPFPVAEFCRGKEDEPAFSLTEQFFFYPAQFWPHKNHISILNALVILKEKYNLTPKVYLTGSDKGNKAYIESKIKEYSLENQVIFTGFLKDEELKYLYTHATAMIFASLMGPNNMPPIEATFLHCPVIITDLDGHKEQLKDTALYFNGYKPEQLAIHMQKLLCDTDFRKTIIEKEAELAKTFNDINYFDAVKKILEEFQLIRNTWGKEYIHL